MDKWAKFPRKQYERVGWPLNVTLLLSLALWGAWLVATGFVVAAVIDAIVAGCVSATNYVIVLIMIYIVVINVDVIVGADNIVGGIVVAGIASIVVVDDAAAIVGVVILVQRHSSVIVGRWRLRRRRLVSAIMSAATTCIDCEDGQQSVPINLLIASQVVRAGLFRAKGTCFERHKHIGRLMDVEVDWNPLFPWARCFCAAIHLFVHHVCVCVLVCAWFALVN